MSAVAILFSHRPQSRKRGGKHFPKETGSLTVRLHFFIVPANGFSSEISANCWGAVRISRNSLGFLGKSDPCAAALVVIIGFLREFRFFIRRVYSAKVIRFFCGELKWRNIGIWFRNGMPLNEREVKEYFKKNPQVNNI